MKRTMLVAGYLLLSGLYFGSAVPAAMAVVCLKFGYQLVGEQTLGSWLFVMFASQVVWGLVAGASSAHRRQTLFPGGSHGILNLLGLMWVCGMMLPHATMILAGRDLFFPHLER